MRFSWSLICPWICAFLIRLISKGIRYRKCIGHVMSNLGGSIRSNSMIKNGVEVSGGRGSM